MAKRNTVALLSMLAMLSGPIWAEEEKSEEEKEPEKTLAEKLEEKKAYPGFFNLYRDEKDGSGHLLITDDMLNKTFLYFAHTVNGVVEAGHFKGNYRDAKLIKFRKYFDRIDLVELNPRYYFDPENEISRAAEANISEAVLVSSKIDMEEEGKYAIKLSDVFLNEKIHKVSPYPNPQADKDNKRFKLGKFTDAKSRIVSIDNFPSNTHVVVDYVFENDSPKVRGGNEITDPRYVSVKLQHAFIELQDNEFVARRDDPRVGYFTQEFDDLTSDRTANYRDVINRWHLKKKNPNAKVSDPVKPITWWIENTTPVEWRKTIADAVLAWNSSFEKAGFSNAMEVKVQPDDAEWSADDVRYNVLRWTSSPRPPFGGYGPSVANPYTGEIIAADIMLEYNFMKGRWITASFMTDGNAFNPAEHLVENDFFCGLGHGLSVSTMFGQAAALAKGMGDIEKDKMLKQTMYYLILHEVGHTLGLNHNMMASQIWDEKEIHDDSITKGILAGSVMDYPAINFAPPGMEQGDYYTDKPGPYDDWVIEYGYSEGLADPVAEEARLQKILSRSSEDMLVFGNDADDMRAPGRHIDPRINIFDHSGNAVGYAQGRFELIKDVFKNIKEKSLVEGESYNDLLVGANVVFTELTRQANAVSRYIGGVYLDRNMVGQKDNVKPFTPTPAAVQKEAMQTLRDYVFSPGVIAEMQPVFSYLQKQRRSFANFGKNEDPKLHEMVLKMQQGVLSHLLHPAVLQRIVDTSLYGNEYPIESVMGDLTDAIFAADQKGSVNSFRRNIQADYVEKLIAIAGLESASKFNHMAKASALYELKEVQEIVERSRGDQATKVHRAYLNDRIERAFHKSRS